MREVQGRIRSCAGCGLCCTETYNTLAILPWEAQRIAAHLRGLPAPRREALLARLQQTVRRFRLRRARGAGGALVHYTCAFLESDLRCALPLDVKPAACLSFNPLTPDACDQEPEWFARAGKEAEQENRVAGLPQRREPIPLAVLRALG